MEQETNYGEQSTSGKKRKMPVIIGIASAMEFLYGAIKK